MYQGSLKLCDLSIGSFKKGTPCFDLIHFNRKNKKKDVIYTLQAENMEIKTRWTQWIRDKLFEQMEEGKLSNTTKFIRLFLNYFEIFFRKE